MKVNLAEPRGFCAGVERAIKIVELALERFGAPIYVRKEIVHNRTVVDGLKPKGAIFVDELDEVPSGAVTIFSAHGVSPAVREDAERRGLRVIDATCPLVAKVHIEVQHYVTQGYKILLIGHAGHEEVEGTMGEAPRSSYLIETVEDVDRLDFPPDQKLALVTQTTLSLDDTANVMEAVKRKFPQVRLPAKEDICYATQNRQRAIKQMVPNTDVFLILGASNSSNSLRLREVAVSAGREAYLIPTAESLDPRWLEGKTSVGVSAGASAPESLVEELLERLAALGYGEHHVEVYAEENVEFALPKELADAEISHE
ncbi:MAG: 4-hydroxy-3-methylbut-2-enyl diphosphate reductase [Planctomycetes bacterium]|nr:4-hydroxy-3-methylbut-2-enyl diphosphate reductase [Planctomycetota bacterium]